MAFIKNLNASQRSYAVRLVSSLQIVVALSELIGELMLVKWAGVWKWVICLSKHFSRASNSHQVWLFTACKLCVDYWLVKKSVVLCSTRSRTWFDFRFTMCFAVGFQISGFQWLSGGRIQVHQWCHKIYGFFCLSVFLPLIQFTFWRPSMRYFTKPIKGVIWKRVMHRIPVSELTYKDFLSLV